MAGAVDIRGFFNQRIQMSAMAELKEFDRREKNEERARNWISKVKSSFLRDQATDEEKCLVFRDLPTGPARDWYKQLNRSTRTSWKALLVGFMAIYGDNNGISVGRLYYQHRKQSNDSI